MHSRFRPLTKRLWFIASTVLLLVIAGCAHQPSAKLASLVPIVGQSHETLYAIPANIGDGWEREELSKSGFDAPRLRTLLRNLMGEGTNIHSVIVERHGRLVAELYQRGKDKGVYGLWSQNTDFGPTVLHDTRSMGKSVVSLLLGIAKQQGNTLDLTTPVINYYPEYADLATPNRKTITLAHLLTMSSGIEWSEGGSGLDNEHRLYWKWSPYRYVLSRATVATPGSKWNYNSGGTAVLADILTRVTQTPLKDFARKFLFEPLGIGAWEWVADVHGRPLAFSGLRMRPRDMAKIGRMVLDHGRWRGKQIVPADWVTASLQPRISTGIADFQYGYQWWLGTVEWQGKKLAWGAAFGNGGQRLFVVPDLDMTVVITAGAYGDPNIAPRVNAFFKDVVSTVQK